MKIADVKFLGPSWPDGLPVILNDAGDQPYQEMPSG